MKLDLLAFAAHPDDVEFTCAGTMILMTKKGYRTGVVDCTGGELGTRGSAATRASEAKEAAKIMKLAVRRNLGMPDGNIEISQKNVKSVVTAIREFRPRILLAPYFVDRHPDHSDCSVLIKRAMFYAGLKKYATRLNGKAQAAHRPEVFLMYRSTTAMPISIVVDVTSVFKEKMKAVKIYASQVHDPKNPTPDTFISRPEFLDMIEARARESGFLVNAQFGEAFYKAEPLWTDDLFTMLPKDPQLT